MLPFFTIFILFLILVTYNRHRIEKIEKKREQEFWNRESEANATRRKDISFLPYIVIPTDTLPFGIRPQDETLSRCEEQIRTLSHVKILNLTGKTNTELKLEYGAPNLTFLTECDQNYTDLVRTMHAWGTRLYELALPAEAEQVLSLAITWGSDIRGSYLLLAQIYKETGNPQGIRQLTEAAKGLNSLMKESILTGLKKL